MPQIPKKVCFLISNNFLHDNRTKKLALSLSESGYDVQILCAKNAQKLPSRSVYSGIKINRVIEGWLPIFPKNKEHIKQCQKYLKAVLSTRADIYICKDLDTLFYGWRAGRKYNAKLVYNADEYWQDLTLGDLGPKTKIYYKFVFFFLERALAQRADLIITVNKLLANKMQKNLFLRRKPLVIMNMPEGRAIDKRSTLINDTSFIDKDIIIYVGIISEGRGIENLVKAMAYLPDNFRLAILGYGNLQKNIQELINDNQLNRKIKILKPVAHEDLFSYIAPAKLGIIPILPISTSYKYCLPNKFFEYILSGLPICSAKLPAIEELLTQYKIGITYDPYDIQEMVKSIKSMVANERSYEQYKANLRIAANALSWENEKRVYLSAIKEL